MHDGPLLAPALLLAAVLMLSGLAKVRSPRSARDAFTSLRLPAGLAGSPVPAMVPWAEIVLAGAVLVLPGPWAAMAAAAGLVLMLVYLGLVVRALGFDEPVTCHCFGELGLGEVTRRTAARNALLVLVAALAVVGGTAERPLLARLLDAPATTWAWLAMTVLVAVVALLVLDGNGATGPHVPPTEGEEALDYLRQPIPYGLLVDADGQGTPLRLLASERAVLLVFLSLGCGPCMRVAPRISAWVDDLRPVDLRVVVSQDLATVGDEHDHLRPFLLHDPEMGVLRTFGTGTPSAVLLGADGLLAGGPVVGEQPITELVEEIVVQLRAELPEDASTA